MTPMTGCDGAAIGVALLSVFKVIPWAEVAAFLSAVYLVARLYYIIRNKGK